MAYRTGFSHAALVQHLRQGPRSAPEAAVEPPRPPRDWVTPVVEQARALPRLASSPQDARATARLTAAIDRLETERSAVAMAELGGALRDLARCWRMASGRTEEAACESAVDAVSVAVRNME